MNSNIKLRSREISLAAIFFLILWLGFFYRVFAGHVLSGGDLVNQYIPYKHFLKSWLLKGILPLWNPHTFSGRPFQADIQIGIFYPPSWLCLVMPIPVFFTVLTILHLWFASLGAYLLSRRFLRLPVARFFFALVFSLSAFFTARLYSGIVLFIFAASYIPWILYAAELWRERRSNGAILLLGFLLVLQLLSGSPQVAYYVWIALLILFLVQLPKSKGQRPLWFGYAAAFLLMLALGAVQILPTKEYVEHSYERAHGAEWDYVTKDSLEVRNLVSFVTPGLFCPPRREEIYWGGTVGFWEYNGYLGIAPLVLAILFFVLRPFKKSAQPSKIGESRRRFFLFSLILFLLWLTLAFGRYSALFWLFYRVVPGFNRFRCPVRLVIFYIIAVAFFSSAALERVIEISKDAGVEARRLRHRALYALLIMAALGVCVVALFFAFPIGILKTLGLGRIFHPEDIQYLTAPIVEVIKFARRSALIFATFLFTSCVLIAAIMFFKRRARITILTLLGVVVADLFIFGIPQIESVPYADFANKFYPDTKLSALTTRAVDAHQRFVFTDDVFYWQNDQNQMEVYPNRGMLKGLYNARGYDPVFIRRYGEFFNAIGYFEGTETPGGFLRLVEVKNPILLSLLNVRGILTYTSYRIPGWRLAGKFPFGLNVYENTNAFGNAFLATAYSTYSVKKSIIRRVLRSTRFNFRRFALTPDENPYKRHSSPKDRENESVRLIHYSPNRREYEVIARGSDTLVFSEVYYAGWRAYIDGAPVPVRIVDYALWGVFLKPGRHRIVCVFRPRTFIIGAVITLCTLIGLLLWLISIPARRVAFSTCGGQTGTMDNGQK